MDGEGSGDNMYGDLDIGTSTAGSSSAEDGADIMDGGPGVDTITGGTGSDTLYVGDGNDTIFAQDGGTGEAETIDCGDGTDEVFADLNVGTAISNCELIDYT